MNELLVSYIKSKISVTEEELNTILSYFKTIKLKNELLLAEGQVSQRSFFVTKGCLRIFFINEEGQEATRYFAFENQFASALVSFITAEKSKEFIQAVEPTEVFTSVIKIFIICWRLSHSGKSFTESIWK